MKNWLCVCATFIAVEIILCELMTFYTQRKRFFENFIICKNRMIEEKLLPEIEFVF